MNYTVTMTQIDKEVSHVVLSAKSPVPGVTVVLNPKEFTFLGFSVSASLQVSAGPNVTSSIVPVEIVGTTAKGVASQSFDFGLERQTIVAYHGTTNFAKPTTLRVSAGQTVTWLDLVEVDDDGNGYLRIVLSDGSAASPTMVQFDRWSHSFGKPGTYTYQVTALGYGGSSGTVVVA
jgi:plastocyanin